MTDRKTGRNTDGTFAKGNPGKPTGSRHRATQAALDLLDVDSNALTAKAIEMALGGDTVALRLCLERIIPPRKDCPIAFDMPAMNSAADAAQAAGAVLDAVAIGDLTPIEGAHIMALIESYRKTLEVAELETRITVLEQANET